jgi:GTP pyrophosphokinase
MIGAKIDGRMVSLDTRLQTGMIISIITTNATGHGPSRDWIKLVKTSSTRNKIRGWFKRERREENIQQGKQELEREFRRNNIHLEPAELESFLKRLARSQHLATPDDFLAAIGYGGISLSKIIAGVKELYLKHYKITDEEQIKKQLEKTANQRPKKASSGVIVEGLEGCLVKFARCCNPLPGDAITGFVTRGFGVSIHKQDCINVASSINDPNQSERWVRCEWADNTAGEMFKSTVDIFGKDRPGLLVDVSVALNNMRLPVYTLMAKEQPDDSTSIQITFGTSSLSQLEYIIGNLRKISGIERVERTVQ